MKKKIIYQLQFDRFVGNIPKDMPNEIRFMGGHIRGVISRLGYIKDMGFNTILMTPILKTTNYHGYHTEDFFAIDPHFGTIQDVKALIQQAHNLGMELMFDFVPNHCSIEHSYFKQAQANENSKYRNWFYFKNDEYLKFFNFAELAKLNVHNPDVSSYLIDSCKYWVKLGFDHIRIDHAIGVPFNFLSQLKKEINKMYPNVTFIGEVWGQGMPAEFYHTVEFKDREAREADGLDQENMQLDYVGVLDGVIDFKFRTLLIEAVKRGERCIGNEKLQHEVDSHFQKYPSNYDLLLMLDNHDIERFLFYCDGNKDRLLDAFEFMAMQGKSFSMYYGTECLMNCNPLPTADTPFNDISSREPFEWYKPEITTDIRKIIKHST